MNTNLKAIKKIIAILMTFSLVISGVSLSFAEENAETAALVYGDVNSDESINAADALLVLKSAAKMEVLTDAQNNAADVNGDGNIDAKDALLILQKAAKIIDKFPVEEIVPTESDDPVPTESEEPVPTESEEPVPTESDEPVPTQTATTDVIDNAFVISVKDAGAVADVDGTKITFKEADETGNGVLMENPFIGKDTTNGAAISFFITSPIDIEPVTYAYTSIISIVNAAHNQILKYDMEGTRQLATNPTPKLNYWAAALSITAGEEYFITLVARADGLHYYINGTNIGRGEYSQLDETKGREAAMAIFSAEGAELYLGGTVNVPETHKDLCKNKVPAGTAVRDVVGYVGELTDEDVTALYEMFKSGNPVISTPAPDDTPTESDEPVPTESDEPVPTESDEPVPTESDEPVPTESDEPTPSEDVSTESVVEMKVKELNDAATSENGVITFVETESKNGVLMENPFANRELTNGGSISFWYTPSTDTKAAALITLVNYTDLLQFARFNDNGTWQFRDAYSTQIYNVWSVDTKFEAGTSYFMTAVMSDDGIKYYANGEPIVITDTKSNPGLKNEDQVKSAIVPLITNPNTNFYLGGTVNIWETQVDYAYHALPAGLEIKDVMAHMSALSDEEVKTLYEATLNSSTETP